MGNSLSIMANMGFLLITLSIMIGIDFERNFPSIDLRKWFIGQQSLILGVVMVFGAFALSFVA